MGFVRRIWGWFDDRTGIVNLIKPSLVHPVPRGVTSNGSGWWYVFGLATLAAFIVQGITGMVLATKYIPSPAHAYDSLQFITNDVTFGRTIRGIHYFSASAMVVMMGIHAIRVFLTGSYKFPREMCWITGVLLMVLTLAMAFTGQLLRWDQDGIWGLVTHAYFAGDVPVIGGWLVNFMLAGDSLGGATLSRFFAFHVFFLPALLIPILLLHLYLVLRNGISEPPRARRPVDVRRYRRLYDRYLARFGRPYWPFGLWREVVFAALVVLAIIALAVVVGPRELSGPPDPTNVDAAPHPDWYFVWYYALLALYPQGWRSIITVYAPVAVVLLLLVLPIFAGRGERSPTRRPWAVGGVVVVVLALAGLTAVGFRASWVPDFEAELPVAEVVDVDVAEPPVLAGATLFQERGCLACHTVAGYGGRYGPDLTNITDQLPRQMIKIRILQGIGNMPAYGDILTAQETESIVRFLESLEGP
jgi:ubiquinol-cytochrome c reductase cytochrome b subunit